MADQEPSSPNGLSGAGYTGHGSRKRVESDDEPGRFGSRQTEGSRGTAQEEIGRTRSANVRYRDHGERSARDIEEQMKSMLELAGGANSGEGQDLLGKLRDLEDQWWMRDKLHRVVLTGGPCAGKSTVMTDLTQLLREKNFLVFTMPEIATEMFNWSDGKMWEDYGEDGPDGDKRWAELQISLTRVQIVIEDSINQMMLRSLARRRRGLNPPRGAVFLLDRGVVDNLAYCSKEAWAIVLEELGTTTARLRDTRYDHVIHLVTAANGAEQYYTLVQAEGGAGELSARMETSAEARQLDLKTQKAWQGAKNHYIVSNVDVDFNQKRNKVKEVVNHIIGDKSEGSARRRILCDYVTTSDLEDNAIQCEEVPWSITMRIVMIYLTATERLQKRECDNESITYYHQTLNMDGTVARQYQMDHWTFSQKVKVAKNGRAAMLRGSSPFTSARSATTPEEDSTILEELHSSVVIFTHTGTYVRCYDFTDSNGEKLLLVEVDEDLDYARCLPSWLKPKNVNQETDRKHTHFLA